MDSTGVLVWNLTTDLLQFRLEYFIVLVSLGEARPFNGTLKSCIVLGDGRNQLRFIDVSRPAISPTS